MEIDGPGKETHIVKHIYEVRGRFSLETDSVWRGFVYRENIHIRGLVMTIILNSLHRQKGGY